MGYGISEKTAAKRNQKIVVSDELHLLIHSKTHGTHRFEMDRADAILLSGRVWYMKKAADRRKSDHALIYAASGQHKYGNFVLLHRLIASPPDDLMVDHIDGNTLNSRRSNLRAVTSTDNVRNQVTAKGYTWHVRSQRWEARIVIGGKNKYLGGFKTEEEAHAAYLAGKLKYHGLTPGQPAQETT